MYVYERRWISKKEAVSSVCSWYSEDYDSLQKHCNDTI